jgi:hypothetical protein
LIVPEEGHMNVVNDLCNLLTFLTGRRVTTKEYLDDHNPDRSLNNIVNIHNIIFEGNNYWNNLKNISNLTLGVPFVNLTYAFESNEFLGMSIYITSTLNAIYGAWWKKENLKFINKRIKQKLRTKLNKSLTFTLKKKLRIILKNEHIENDIIEDIDKTINGMGNPSAIYQLKQFLKYLEVYPLEENENQFKKLKWINQIRNRLVHSGNIPRAKGMSVEQAMGISFSVILLCLSITQLYFASKLLNIKDRQIDILKNEVTQYFKTGKFSGKDVFYETFDEYLENMNTDWVYEGLLPGMNN